MISSNAYIFVLAVPLVVLRESIFTALFPCFLLHIPLQPDFHFLFLFLSFFRRASQQDHPHGSFNLAVGKLKNMTGSMAVG